MSTLVDTWVHLAVSYSADKKLLGLGRQFLDLKKNGKLDKFLEKKSKKRSNKGLNVVSSHSFR